MPARFARIWVQYMPNYFENYNHWERCQNKKDACKICQNLIAILAKLSWKFLSYKKFGPIYEKITEIKINLTIMSVGEKWENISQKCRWLQNFEVIKNIVALIIIVSEREKGMFVRVSFVRMFLHQKEIQARTLYTACSVNDVLGL